jgi:uncharacterized delta-60 repeat protein
MHKTRRSALVTGRAPRRAALAGVLLAAAIAPGAQAAPAPVVSSAPGRVVFAVDNGALGTDANGSGVTYAAALPDGGAVLVGTGAPDHFTVYAARIGPRGALDRSFGSQGVAKLAVPGGATFELQQVLRQSDGKLLLVGARDSPPTSQPQPGATRMQVTRLNSDATLDRAYGVDGTATTVVDESCGRGCTIAALAPDGALVLAGAIEAPAAAPPPPGTQPTLRWVVTRLTPSGATDASFGPGGLAEVAAPGTARAFYMAVDGGGRIVTAASTGSTTVATLLLTRLTAGGDPDVTFAGGTPVAAAFRPGVQTILQADGAIVVTGSVTHTDGVTPSRYLLARYTESGALDATFGTDGLVDLKTSSGQLLPAADGGVLVVSAATANPFGLAPERGGVNVARVAPDGVLDPAFGGQDGRYVDLPFGGGLTAYAGGVPGQKPPPLLQNSFVHKLAVPRPDGSYLLAGGVRVAQPSPDGQGASIGRFATAALTPSFALDAAFGGSATPLTLSVRIARQRARTTLRRGTIRIVLNASAVGLTRVRIMRGGRTVAGGQLPVFAAGPNSLGAPLTAYGRRYLRRHPRAVLTGTASTRDVLTNRASATFRGRLR